MNDAKPELYLETRGSIAVIMINRPSQRNAMTLAMWREMRRLAAHVEADASIRVLILRGEGGEAFSAGADIAEFDQVRGNSEQARKYSEDFDGALDAVWNLGKPVIALIEGFCVGGGLELASAADLRIATPDSRFGIPTARLGVLVGYREMRRLLHLVGAGGTSRMLISAEILDAAEALRIGLITLVAERADIENHVFKMAEDIAGMAPLIHRWHKRIMRTVLMNPSLLNLSPEEESLQFASFDTDDFVEGRQAFLEKRRPRFEGK